MMGDNTLSIFDKITGDVFVDITRDNTCGDTFLKSNTGTLYQIDSNTYDLIRHVLLMHAEKRLGFSIKEE